MKNPPPKAGLREYPVSWNQPSSFLRYPGGKQRMLAFLKQHLPAADSIEGTYYEPFVGGGSVFLSICPVLASLSDINPDLIAVYKGLKEAPREVWALYEAFGSTKGDYHYLRGRFEGEDMIHRASRILYLNRTCFKGMWRHNRDGEFNVGYGGQARRWVISEEYLVFISKLLERAVIECGDFEAFIDKAVQGDFLFIDPPYKPGEREHSNAHYVWQRFRFKDYDRLAQALKRSSERMVRWAMTVSAHQDLVKLLEGNYVLPFPCGTGNRPGILTTDVKEVLITNYQMEGGRRI